MFLIRDDTISELHQIIGQQQQMMESQKDMTSALIGEIRELRRVGLNASLSNRWLIFNIGDCRHSWYSNSYR